MQVSQLENPHIFRQFRKCDNSSAMSSSPAILAESSSAASPFQINYNTALAVAVTKLIPVFDGRRGKRGCVNTPGPRLLSVRLSRLRNWSDRPIAEPVIFRFCDGTKHRICDLFLAVLPAVRAASSGHSLQTSAYYLEGDIGQCLVDRECHKSQCRDQNARTTRVKSRSSTRMARRKKRRD